MSDTKMRVNLSGLCGNAADCIKEMLDALKAVMDEDDFDDLEESLQPSSMAFSLREVSKHAKGTANGEHSIDDFADHYCLKTTK